MIRGSDISGIRAVYGTGCGGLRIERSGSRPDAATVLKANDGRMVNQRSIRAGLIASGALAVFYAAVVGGASRSLEHLTDQAGTDWYLLLPIIAGFGVQVALLVELRHRHRIHAHAMAASGAGAGASTAGMIACCAHHIADLVPFLGATGVAAFLTDWRVPLLVVAVGVNAVAIAIAVRRLRRFPTGPKGEIACAHA